MKSTHAMSHATSAEPQHHPLAFIQNLVQKTAEGAALGTAAMSVIAPLSYWTSVSVTKQPFIRQECMAAWKVLVAAVSTETAVAYLANAAILSMVQQGDQPLTKWQTLMASSMAGAIVGAVNNPLEIAALAKQVEINKNVSTKAMASLMVKNNGIASLWRGGAMVISREALWASVYLSITPIISTFGQDTLGCSKVSSHLMASVIAGAGFGVISTPINVLRIEQQGGLMQAKAPETYATIAKRYDWPRLFGSWKQRTATTTAASLLFTGGMQVIEEVKQSFSKA